MSSKVYGYRRLLINCCWFVILACRASFSSAAALLPYRLAADHTQQHNNDVSE
jgi:hypothetical protein